jgi:hypothetical protein
MVVVDVYLCERLLKSRIFGESTCQIVVLHLQLSFSARCVDLESISVLSMDITELLIHRFLFFQNELLSCDLLKFVHFSGTIHI